MMICPQCQTSNSLENKFCRECGASLQPAAVGAAAPAASVVAPEDRTIPMTPTLASDMPAPAPISQAEQVQIQERAAHLMAEAASLEQRGWLADATARAEKAAALLPGTLAPMSLLVGLYEAQGDRSKALAMQENIVRAYPDAPSERERVMRLRKEAREARLAASEAHSLKALLPHAPTAKAPDRAEKPVPYLPLAVAGGVAALIFCVGVSLIGNKRSSTPQITETTLPAYNAPLNAPLNAQPNAPSALGAGANPNAISAPSNLPPDTRTDPFARQQPGGNLTQAAPGFTPPTPPARRATTNGTGRTGTGQRVQSLPLPGTLSAPGQVNNGPIRFVPPAAVSVQNGQEQNPQRIIARPPTEIAPGPNSTGVNNTPPAAPEDPGYIRIQVNPGTNPPPQQDPPAGGGSGDGNSSSTSGTDSVSRRADEDNENALSRARHLQGQGRYAEAILAYRVALAATPMPPGEIYQGLAQSYQRSGDKVAARSGYQSAIRSYETQVSAGQRSPAAQRGLEACRAALEVLGG